MFGLDEKIASLASGEPLAALAVALLLGLRHPLDPDHLAAVGAMARASGQNARGAAIRLAWGAGHATTVLILNGALHLDVLVLQRLLEALIGAVILALGLRLLLRHGRGSQHPHPHRPPASQREAYGVGMVHGAGGTAGIGLLLVAAIPGPAVALTALLVFALATALAMSAVAAGLGRALHALPARAIGVSTCAFGAWYLSAAALGAPYAF